MKFGILTIKTILASEKILCYKVFEHFWQQQKKKTTYFFHKVFQKKKELGFFGERYDNNIKLFDKIMWKTK
jgi:hypothetical protein